MNSRIWTLMIAATLVGFPSACGKDSGGGGSKKKPTATPSPSTPNTTPTPQTPTPQSQTPTIQNWEEFNGKALYFKQSIGEESAKFNVLAPLAYETYFQNGQINPSADRTPKDMNGTLCFLRYKAVSTTKAKTAISSGSRFIISQVSSEKQGITYNEASLEGNMQGSTENFISKVICRKHIDAGLITAGDLQTAFGTYIEIQGQ